MKLFIDFMNIRYSKLLTENKLSLFRFWDDYALFLFEVVCNSDEDKYYNLLEKDIKLYSDMQTGIER